MVTRKNTRAPSRAPSTAKPRDPADLPPTLEGDRLRMITSEAADLAGMFAAVKQLALLTGEAAHDTRGAAEVALACISELGAFKVDVILNAAGFPVSGYYSLQLERYARATGLAREEPQ
jgi:hypothetical protein